jgi:site-specific DNA-adenine methylase
MGQFCFGTYNAILDDMGKWETTEHAIEAQRKAPEVLKNLAASRVPSDPAKFAAVFILLQAGAYHSKPIGVQNNKWINSSFRTLFEPKPHTKRQSITNVLCPLPKFQVEIIREALVLFHGVNVVHGDALAVNPQRSSSCTVLYMDPPYEGTHGYNSKFNSAFVDGMLTNFSGCWRVVSESVRLNGARSCREVGNRSHDPRKKKNTSPEVLSIWDPTANEV